MVFDLELVFLFKMFNQIVWQISEDLKRVTQYLK